MNRYIPILQGHVYVARVNGSTVTEATAPATTTGDPPEINPLYLKLGEALSGGITPEIETKPIIRIVGGIREEDDIVVKERYTARVTVQELNKLVVDLLFGSNTTATDGFTAAGSQGRKAWVFMQAMDSASQPRVLLLGLAHIQPAGEVNIFGEDVFTADFEIKFRGRPAGTLINAYGS